MTRRPGGETQVQWERRRTHKTGQAGGCRAVGPIGELAKRRAMRRCALSLAVLLASRTM